VIPELGKQMTLENKVRELATMCFAVATVERNLSMA
jgi:hypothetical protein